MHVRVSVCARYVSGPIPSVCCPVFVYQHVAGPWLLHHLLRLLCMLTIKAISSGWGAYLTHNTRIGFAGSYCAQCIWRPMAAWLGHLTFWAADCSAHTWVWLPDLTLLWCADGCLHELERQGRGYLLLVNVSSCYSCTLCSGRQTKLGQQNWFDVLSSPVRESHVPGRVRLVWRLGQLISLPCSFTTMVLSNPCPLQTTRFLSLLSSAHTVLGHCSAVSQAQSSLNHRGTVDALLIFPIWEECTNFFIPMETPSPTYSPHTQGCEEPSGDMISSKGPGAFVKYVLAWKGKIKSFQCVHCCDVGARSRWSSSCNCHCCGAWVCRKLLVDLLCLSSSCHTSLDLFCWLLVAVVLAQSLARIMFFGRAFVVCLCCCSSSYKSFLSLLQLSFLLLVVVAVVNGLCL